MEESTHHFGGNATVCGRAWYKLVDAPVLTLDVTGSAGAAGDGGSGGVDRLGL